MNQEAGVTSMVTLTGPQPATRLWVDLNLTQEPGHWVNVPVQLRGGTHHTAHLTPYRGSSPCLCAVRSTVDTEVSERPVRSQISA